MKNPIREILAAGKPAVGSWLNLTSPLAGELMASIGFSWLVADAEHSALGVGELTHMFRGIEARGVVPMARIWDHDPVTIARLLDAGTMGICFPHVSTPEQAEDIVRAMRYPPQGTRSIGTGRYLTMSPDYFEHANEEVLCIPQIEDLQGIENAEAIARVDGVDIGFLGPGDLALSMGVKAGHPDHEAALQRFREGCARAGKPSGIPVADGPAAKRRIEEGFQFIDLGNDVRFLEAAAKANFAEIKDLL